MAQLPNEFKAKDHEGLRDFEPLPAGMYIARIVESEMKQCKETAKDPDGQYLKLTIRLDEGQKYAGRQLWVNLNLINKNEKAVEIAQNELASITTACGKSVVRDSNELHGIPMRIKVAVVPDGRGADFPPQNQIKKYEPVDGASSSGASESSSEGGNGKKKAPWD